MEREKNISHMFKLPISGQQFRIDDDTSHEKESELTVPWFLAKPNFSLSSPVVF